MWADGSRKCSSPAERFFFIPVIKINFVHDSTFSYSMITACRLSNGLPDLRCTQYSVNVEGHTHLRTFQFPIIGNQNMAAMQTCEEGSTMALPTAQYRKFT